MPWTVEISKLAGKQLRQLDPQVKGRIADFLEERVALLKDPRDVGASLNGNFKGLWKYRVGDYRVICELRYEVLVVHVVKVEHRREAYRKD